MVDNFVNLHNHSDYSILDGFGTINEYVDRAIELGQPALGLTDHGNICGLHNFIELCNAKGIVPIPGMEAYVSPVNPDGARCHHPIRYGQPGQESIDVSGNGAYVHMTLFAMNDTGMHSLYKLVREASIEGNAFNHLGLKEGEGNYYNKPRIDFDMLAKYNDGLIATSGCPSGEIQTRFRLGQDEQAYDYARRMKELFGKRYFIEIMDHSMQGNDIERMVIPKLIELSEDLNIPLLATNDSHYCRKEDAPHHEEMLCSNSKAKMTDDTSDNGGPRFAFNGNEYYLKTYDDMMSIPVFQEHPEAVQNTLKLASMIEHIEFKLRPDLRPEVPIPAGYTDETWLKEKIREGYMEKRVKEGADEKTLTESKKRIAHELPVFVNNNFMQYMLVVQDYINWARENGIGVGFGRGCFLPGMKVRNSNGVETNIENIKVGVKAQTHDSTYHTVEKMFTYDVANEDCVEVELDNGRIIKCTADHMLFSKNIGFIKAEDLNAGDAILGPKGRKEPVQITCDNCGKTIITNRYKYEKIIAKTEYKPSGEYWCNECANKNTHMIESVKAGSIKGALRNKDNDVKMKNSLSGKKNWELNREKRIKEIQDYWINNPEQHEQFKQHCRDRNIKRYADPLELERLSMQSHGKYLHGIYHSYQNDKDIYYASSYELKALNIFETDSEVINYDRCKDSIDYISPDDNNHHKYLPDFYVQYKNGDVKVIEVKSEWQTHEPKTIAKIEAAHSYYDDKNIDYEVWTEKELYNGNDIWHNDFTVKSVKHFKYTGKVYDLQIEGVHNYVINGITVHNSVGGSEIAYLMNISDTDPIRHDLMFERFLNPERISPPDVDTDFAASRRDEVVDYVKKKYGESHIANIITFNKFLSKTAIADMARIYGISVGDTERAKKLIPELKPNTPAPLSMLYDENSSVYQAGAAFRELMEKPQWQPVIKAARAIEGRIKTTGVHACGLIMSSHPITDAAPFTYKHNPDKPWGSSCCQWTYPELEAIGLIKMDFLSLSDLDIVSDTLANIRHTHNGKAPDMSELVHGPMNDKATYDMLSRGETSNIFQTSSTGMQALFKRMHPSKFEDIAASVALYRPGPMGMDAHTEYADRAAGKKPAYVVNEELDKAFHNTDVDKILAPTEGLLCYQEQCMNISRLMSGFSWGDADKLRKGMGHKQIDVLNAMEPKFIEGAVKNGYPEKATNKLWNYILDFGKYGFNKCLNGRTAVCIVSDDGDYMKARIEDIYREHESGTPLNIQILSMYPDGSIRPHKVKSITKQPDKMPTYAIRTASGKCIHATSNHRLLTTDGYGCIDDGMIAVGAELITDENWSRRLRFETIQTRRNNALTAARSENGRESSRKHMRAYQSTLTYADRSNHQKRIQELHPDRTDNAIKAMHDRIQWLRENDEDWNKAFNENVLNNLMLSGNDGIYGRKTPLSDGRICDSMVEAEAGEYLIARGVDFELHKQILGGVSDNPKYCDFYANGLYFEMDGLHRGRQYFIDNKYGNDIPFVYMTPFDYKDVIDEALMSYHVENGDMIVSITPTKTLEKGKAMCETVYDIEMEDDGPSNFIADGIVSHNSHACSYGIITYETAYLKCHYPAEFMAAILTDKIRNAKDVDDVKNAIREVRNIGLKVGALDIDSSDVGVSAMKKQRPDDPDIVFGISGIKGISPATAKKFVDWRDKNHPEPYVSFDDFMRSLPPELISKKLIDGLAGAGAFDKFGMSRRAIVTVVPELLEFYKNEARQKEAGKESLFDDFEDDEEDESSSSFVIPPIPDWDWITRLEQEEKRLGVAVSGHPMSHIGDGLKFLQRGYASLENDIYGTVITVDDAVARNIPSHESMKGRTYYDSVPVRIIADISDIEEKRTKTGDPILRGRIESESATMPFTISKDTADKVYADYKNGYGIHENHVYIITGKLTIDWNGNHSITAEAFDELVLDNEGRTPIWIHLYKRNVENKKSPGYTKLMRILHNKKYAGDTPVYIHLYDEDHKIYDSMDTGVTVSCSDEFMMALENLLGSKRLGRWPITAK